MSTERRIVTAQRACTRCSKSKKRCDRVIPCCGLCSRLGKRCEYEAVNASYVSPVSPVAKTSLAPEAVAIARLKDAVIHELYPLTPEHILSAYSDSIALWFPIAYNLQGRLRPAWEDNALDVALLCLSIRLVAAKPLSTLNRDGSPLFTNLYLQTKSNLALVEGLGLNSLPIVQSRILLTLFEVSHGIYPAAYISAATTLRTMDALEMYPTEEALQSKWLSGVASQEETVWTWCGILVLDSRIAIEAGSQASLSRLGLDKLHSLLKPYICPTHLHDQDRDSPVVRLSRIMEATVVLDRIYSIIHDPSPEHEFNKQEIRVAVDTSVSLQGILAKEIAPQAHIYSSGIALCHTAHLLVFENMTKVASSMNATSHGDLLDCTIFKQSLLTVTSIVEPFTTGACSLDLNTFPPLVTFMVYKAAMLTTQRFSLDIDGSDGLASLKFLRKFLSIVSERWLCCKRYLEILDENTTPKLMKALV